MSNQRQKYVMGNWKMNGTFSSIQTLLTQLLTQQDHIKAKTVVFPPMPYLSEVSGHLKESVLLWGGQNVYPATHGAFTGEIAGPMLKEFGCQYVLVGHSERRHLFKESDEFVAQKFRHVKECDMMPVFCIGETLAEREQGQTETVLVRQLSAVYEHAQGFSESIIAYEPVWAIGTGQSATPEQVQETHAFVRAFIAENEPATAPILPILYGGSVTPENAKDLFVLKDVDGGLVGGASLDAERFLGILRCIN